MFKKISFPGNYCHTLRYQNNTKGVRINAIDVHRDSFVHGKLCTRFIVRFMMQRFKGGKFWSEE